MKRHLFFFFFLCVLCLWGGAQGGNDCGGGGREKVTGAYGMEKMKEMVEGLEVFNVVDFGAVGDGRTMNTQAIQKAIDTATSGQGGIVQIPKGFYLSGALEIKSNVILEVVNDGVLLASHSSDDYPGPWDAVTKSGINMPVFLASFDAQNIGLIGDGRIDGQALPYFDGGFNRSDDKYIPITWPLYGCQGECRPRLVQFVDSENILLQDITLMNSPDWTSHYVNCTNILIEGVTILGDFKWPNNDGIDPDSSRNITITHTRIDTGDDNICPKSSSGKGHLSNLLVTNCHLRSRSSAIKFGSATHEDMHDALFQNIWIHNSGRALSIQQRDSGNIYNIEYNNITIDGTSYQPTSWWGAGEGIWVTSIERKEGQGVGKVWDVRYVDVRGRVENGALFSSRGGVSSGGPLENVTLCGVKLEVNAWHPKFDRRIEYLPPEHDYRPTNVVPDARVLCNTAGMYFENVIGGSVIDSKVRFVGERESWWGACTGYNSSYANNVAFTNFQCVNG